MASLGDKYELGERIGGGGMAEVFRGVARGAEGFERPVAIKRMRRGLSRDPAFGQMFVNEARLASLLSHPNIASVLDFARGDDGRYVLVMELVDGVDLRQIVATGRLPVTVSIYLATEILRGLDAAHRRIVDGRPGGIIHRDMSPHNVMVSWDGSVKLVDFGIAKAVAATTVSRSGALKGKVAYMSPEQAHGRDLDGRSDLFAVGVVLHELLTGRRLFHAASAAETLSLLLTAPVPRPSELVSDVSAELDAIVAGLLERDRERRTPTARAALEALLASSAASPRARLELEEILAARFPSREPGGRGETAPSEARPAIAVPVAPGTPPTAAGRGPAAPSLAHPRPPVSRGVPGPIQSTRPGLGPEPGGGAASPAAPVQRTLTATGSSARSSAAPVQRTAAATGPSAASVQRTLTATGSSARSSAAPVQRTATATEASSPAPPRSGAGRWIAVSLALSAAVIAGAFAVALSGRAAPAPLTDAAAAGPVADAAPVAELAPSDAAPAADAAALASPAPAPAEARPAAAERTPTRRPRPRADATPAVVEVKARGTWGLVRVGDKVYGQTPRRIELPPGRHTIWVENPERGLAARRTVTLAAGAHETVVLDLSE